MADLATKINSVYCLSSPPVIIGLWRYPLVDATSFIEIELPTLSNSFMAESLSEQPGQSLNSKAYVIDLKALAVSCTSVNFNFSILNIDSEAMVNTFYEVANYTGVNLSVRDNFDTFMIRNRDNPLENKLYFYLTGASGTLNIELSYITLQDRPFSDN